MSNKTLAQIIQNNIRIKNLEAESGSGDIVIYDNESGAYEIEDIALEIGAVYEMFVTSAVNLLAPNKKYGQQKITLKLIPMEDTPNNYDLYMPVHFYETTDGVIATYIHIYNYDTELWNIFSANNSINIYKIVKKAV